MLKNISESFSRSLVAKLILGTLLAGAAHASTENSDEADVFAALKQNEFAISQQTALKNFRSFDIDKTESK